MYSELKFLTLNACFSFNMLKLKDTLFILCSILLSIDCFAIGELDREEGGEDSEHKQEVPTASGIQIKLYTVHPKYEANLLLHVHLLSRDHSKKKRRNLLQS